MMNRILCIVTQMNRGGLESRLMDICRNIDRTKVQLDFYTFRKEQGAYDDEIFTMGGKVYYNEPLSIKKLFKISKQIKKFLIQHPEYKIVHAHMNAWCGVILKGAKQAKVPIRIAHSRAATEGHSLEVLLKNVIKKPTNLYATHRFAVSQKAAI